MTKLLDKAPDTKQFTKRAKRAAKEASTTARSSAKTTSKRVRATAQQAKDSDIAESVVAAVGAVLPFVSAAMARRSTARRAAAAVPVVTRAHPVLMVFAAIGGAVSITLAARAWHKRRAARALEAGSDDLGQQHARFDDEGGVVGWAADTGDASAARGRAGNGSLTSAR